MHESKRYFVDLHIHSRFARATSRSLTLPVLDEYAQKKGLQVLGTGDSTHPLWFAELRSQLEPAPEPGLYVRKEATGGNATRFIPSVEISSIYTQGGKGRRVHLLVLFPSLEAAGTFNERLRAKGANLSSDGRPIVGLSCKAVAELAFAAHPQSIVIPAHAWTPWFGVFGSMSGFDSLAECFEELTPQIAAIETGLSSDPPMNWQWSALDNVALVSFSDAHSPGKLAREATEFEGELSYAAMYEGLQASAPARAATAKAARARIVRTIEFFPEEGKYHLDGHRDHQVRWTPQERAAHKGVCIVCGRPVTVGVLSRVQALADREPGFKPDDAPEYRSLVPLEEIIADALGAKVGTKKVIATYDALLRAGGNELAVLLEVPLNTLEAASSPLIAEGVKRMRDGQLHIEPGYDGEFGTVHVFNDAERASLGSSQTDQATLF